MNYKHAFVAVLSILAAQAMAAPPQSWDAIYNAAGSGEYASAKIEGNIRFGTYTHYKEVQPVSFKVQDGQVTDYAFHHNISLDEADWKTVVVTWDDLAQPSWGIPVDLNKANIKKMAWEVVGYKNDAESQPTYNFLYVDDLKCVQEVVGIKSARVASNSIKLGVQGSMLSVNLDKAGAVRVQIFDMMGHVVENIGASMNAGSNTVSLEKMSKGSYVVRVIRGSEVKAARVTIR